MSQSEKVKENRLRRQAWRRGWRLTRSPRRDEQASDYGKYALIDVYYSALKTPPGRGGSIYSLDLAGIEDWLEKV